MATRARRLLLAELERQLCRSFPGVPASCAPFCPQAFRFLASAPLGRKVKYPVEATFQFLKY